MHQPRIVVLSGQEAYQRIGRLLNSMVRRPLDITPIGRAIVDLMPKADSLKGYDIAEVIPHQQFNQYLLNDNGDDPSFDQRIVIEIITYGAKVFAAAWKVQAPEGLEIHRYEFKGFMGPDLVLQRR